MDAVYKQEFRVRDLPTRTVTLFPSRAQIVRDIKDVSLKVGLVMRVGHCHCPLPHDILTKPL